MEDYAEPDLGEEYDVPQTRGSGGGVARPVAVPRPLMPKPPPARTINFQQGDYDDPVDALPPQIPYRGVHDQSTTDPREYLEPVVRQPL